jgi:hypothetical protein
MPASRVVIGSLLLLAAACAPRWRAPALVDARKVARALHDPVALGPAFDPTTVPQFAAPSKLRPCCAFGQDLKARVGPVPVPIYENENIISIDDIGPHGYDKGGAAPERDGLVYTCRGGFIDIAHVREHADRTLWLALQIVRALPDGVTLELPDEGTQRRVVVAPLPPGLLERHGRWQVAIALASWAGYQLSIWHEVVTWYGWQSVPGFPEKLSAFSPEDTYSNVLGINIAAGIVEDLEIRSREQYDRSVDAWLREALRRLGAVPKPQARAAMAAVDGLWWDSSKRLPDWKLITRRALDIATTVKPWIVADSVPAERASPEVRTMCEGKPPPLPLRVPAQLGEQAIGDLVTVRFEFSRWLPGRFPLPAGKGATVTQADFPAIVADIRDEGERELGEDFDVPKVRGE